MRCAVTQAVTLYKTVLLQYGKCTVPSMGGGHVTLVTLTAVAKARETPASLHSLDAPWQSWLGHQPRLVIIFCRLQGGGGASALVLTPKPSPARLEEPPFLRSASLTVLLHIALLTAERLS